MNTGETKSDFLLTRRISLFFIIVFSLAIIGIYVFSTNWEEKNKIKKIKIYGTTYSDSDIIESIIWEELSKSNNISLLKQTLEHLPFVKSCNIFHIDSETLEIQLTERLPIAKIKDTSDNFICIDETGQFFSLPTKKNIGVPTIINSEVMNSKKLDLNNLINFLLKLKSANIYHFLNEISEVEDSFLLFTKSSRTKMVFAKNIQYEEIVTAANFINKLGMTKLMNLEKIDFRVNGQIIVR